MHSIIIALMLGLRLDSEEMCAKIGQEIANSILVSAGTHAHRRAHTKLNPGVTVGEKAKPEGIWSNDKAQRAQEIANSIRVSGQESQERSRNQRAHTHTRGHTRN